MQQASNGLAIDGRGGPLNLGERQVRAVAVSGITAKPLGEEALLRFALVVEIAGEERSQQRVGFNPVVEPVDQPSDRGTTSNTPEEITTSERVVRLRVGKKSAVLH